MSEAMKKLILPIILVSAATALAVDYTWTVRLKVRTEKKPGWESHGQLQAFCAGVYDDAVRRNYGLTVRVREADTCYRWYEIKVPVAPADSQYLWFSSGDFDRQNLKAHPALASVWIDEVELDEK